MSADFYVKGGTNMWWVDGVGWRLRLHQVLVVYIEILTGDHSWKDLCGSLHFERLGMRRCKACMLQSLCDHSVGRPVILKVSFFCSM